jgi:lycopene beta-cyclase
MVAFGREGKAARRPCEMVRAATFRKRICARSDGSCLTVRVRRLRGGVDSAPDATATKPSVGPARHAPAPSGPDEYVLVGGGLQNCLIALALLESRPLAKLTLIERDARLGGNHTWCFHEGDVPSEGRSIVDRLVVRSWPSHDVIFPTRRRRIAGSYSAITSDRLHGVVTACFERAPNARRVLGNVSELRQDGVTLDDGRRLPAELVIDARGPEHAASSPGGYQKFVGLELAVEPGSAPEVPILMDATVAQLDGFRFVYVLPWSAGRVLVEDTYYSKAPDLDVPTLRARIEAYAAAAGMKVTEVLREERGVLPIPTALSVEAPANGPLRAGYAGGLFHPTTGYSLPVALRLALHLAARPARSALGADYARWVGEHRRQVHFCLCLNRLLFSAFAPEQRYHVLERFYGLPEATIRRFYALDTSLADRARILCGRPPRGFSVRRLLARGQLA